MVVANFPSTSGLYSGLAITRPIPRQKIQENRMFPYLDTTPCEACKRITVDALVSPTGCRVHTIAEAEISAREGCQLCTMVLNAAGTWNGLDPQAEMIVMRIANTSGTPHCQDQVWVEGETLPLFKEPGPDDDHFLTNFGVYTDEGNVAGNIIPGRRMAIHPDPEASIQLAKRWIERSAEDTGGVFQEMQVLPQRVLDVGQDTVFLRDFSSLEDDDVLKKGNYVCLTHRWDSTTSLHITTTANLSAQKRGMDLTTLPPTFQDAIQITRTLGLQYIWIDSLCILQDSKSDWSSESSKIGTYYSNSHLTIAAGVPSHRGLFNKRDNSPNNSSLQYHKLDLLHPQTATLYFTNLRVNQLLGDEHHSILRRRAWAFQEEVLSPRYLGFHANQMYCRSGEFMFFENGCQEWLYPLATGKRYKAEYPLNPSLLDGGNWVQDIVGEYSGRELTVAGDRLVALSGVAHEYQRVWGGEYLAGLWRQDLERTLCWTKEFATGSCMRAAMGEYRAPSWSWAAIDGKIAQHHTQINDVKIEIMHVSTEPVGPDLLGEVISGLLTLRGVVRRGSISSEEVPTFRAAGHSVTLFDFHVESPGDAISEVTYTFVPDTTDFEATTTGIWVVFITPQVGIVLLPVGDSSSAVGKGDVMVDFERVGLARTRCRSVDPQWFAGDVVYPEKFRTTINIV